MQIIGAGLAGLLAGNIMQRAKLFEAGPEDQVNHKAVLRFRSSAVGDAIGIEFRPVTVHKGIWFDGKFVQPNIQLANLYSQKVINKIIDRSIWNIEPAQRWIAPNDLVAQMAERCHGRIEWNTNVQQLQPDTISTIPMPTLAKLLGVQDAPAFQYAGITVRRWRVQDADAFQTIYFPSTATNLYRATLTGSLLVAEYVTDNSDWRPEQADEEMWEAFGLLAGYAAPLDTTQQRFGKIAPVDEAWRRQFILHATLRHRVYSLGRFATWRNLLLDDALRDIAVIKRLITGGAYAAVRAC